MFSRLVPLLVAVALVVERIQAWGLKTEEQKKAERFVNCLLAIEEADEDQDNRISRQEYGTFVERYNLLLFDEPIGKLPTDLADLYETLVDVSGVPDDEDTIDVFGAGFFHLTDIKEDLHVVCETLAAVLTRRGHEAETPLTMRLQSLKKDDGEEEEEAGSGDE